MATAGDVVSRALRLIKVVGIGRSASAEEMTEGLASLGNMLSSWEFEGVPLDGLGDAEFTAATEVPLPASHIDAIQYNLASRLSVEYGTPPNPILVQLAERGFMALQAAYVQVPILSVDEGLLGSRRHYE